MDRSGHRTIKPPDQAKSRLNGLENLALSSRELNKVFTKPGFSRVFERGFGLFEATGDLNGGNSGCYFRVVLDSGAA
jgi:hypothetical protein